LVTVIVKYTGEYEVGFEAGSLPQHRRHHRVQVRRFGVLGRAGDMVNPWIGEVGNCWGV
jgi:hypothetical protein